MLLYSWRWCWSRGEPAAFRRRTSLRLSYPPSQRLLPETFEFGSCWCRWLRVLLPPLRSARNRVFRRLRHLSFLCSFSPSFPSFRVGAATTMVTELIRAALEPAGGVQLTEAESTLLALGIHADTGACVYSKGSSSNETRDRQVASVGSGVDVFYPDCRGSFLPRHARG